MDLTNQRIEDTYGNVLTIGATAGTPTSGILENGAGQRIQELTLRSLKYDQLEVSPSGTDITTTAVVQYGISIINTATASDKAIRLPEPSLGGIVGIVNNSSVDIYVFPYDSDDSIVGLSAGEPYIIPSDGQLYNITCVQNPSVGVWSVATPTSNNTVRRSVSVSLTADGTVNDGGTYAYSAPLLDASKTTYYPSTGPYDVLNAPLPTNDWFDAAEFNTYNKVRITKVVVKTNVPAGDLTGSPSQISSTLMGITATQLYNLFGYIRVASLVGQTTYSTNELNLLRPLDTYSASVNSGFSTGDVSHYMKNGALYQQLEGVPVLGWQDINDDNGNRRIYYSPYIGYGQTGTPYTGYPSGFSFEAEVIVDFEFSM